jgi:hypothetical protein
MSTSGSSERTSHNSGRAGAAQAAAARKRLRRASARTCHRNGDAGDTGSHYVDACGSSSPQHVGRIVMLARRWKGADWQTLSIPRRGSAEYLRQPPA